MVTRDIAKLGISQVVYTAMCYEHGGMIDDGTVFVSIPTTSAGSAVTSTAASIAPARRNARVEGLQAFLHRSALQSASAGSKSARHSERHHLDRAGAGHPSPRLGWFRFCVGRIGHFKGAPVVVSRTGYTGELGFEVFCHPKDAGTVFDAIWEAGKRTA
ncbi:MAG: hypothetical protein U1E49_08685 [Hyphomicrobiaceae bacterium]